jgi:hypothetical protein
MGYARAAIVVVAVVLSAARLAGAQISVEEAQKRLREKNAQPATTQPISELARLSDENKRLRLRIAQLEAEVSSLRSALGVGQPAAQPAAQATSNPSTRPSAEPQHAQIAGTWRGGDINRGSGYLLDFNADGSYRRTFIAYNRAETGRYQFTNADTIEMWTDAAADTGDRNEYRVVVDNDQLTLTPTRLNGADLRNGRALVLTRVRQ